MSSNEKLTRQGYRVRKFRFVRRENGIEAGESGSKRGMARHGYSQPQNSAIPSYYIEVNIPRRTSFSGTAYSRVCSLFAVVLRWLVRHLYLLMLISWSNTFQKPKVLWKSACLVGHRLRRSRSCWDTGTSPSEHSVSTKVVGGDRGSPNHGQEVQSLTI